MTSDVSNISRTAQQFIVEARRCHGSPPTYDSTWQPVWGAKIDRIEINPDSKSSVATIWFPDLRWQQTRNLFWGDMIRIRNEARYLIDRIVLFQGFITNYLSDFSGGSGQRGTAYERNAIVCQDYRWLLSVTSPIFGQLARGPDDYTGYGTDSQSPISGRFTVLTGRRTIFNADGRPNRDPVLLDYPDAGQIPIFADPDIAVPWTAKDMLRYILCPYYNKAYDYFPISDPSQLPGLNHSDWNKVLSHIVVDGLNVIEAIELLCKHLGWSFREDYTLDGVTFQFYKIGSAAGYTRLSILPTIRHRLHAPAVGESINIPVAQGRKLLWSMSLAEDIAAVMNNPWGLGAPQRFEFTAELVPAWLDSDLVPDTSEELVNLFFTEAALQEITNPNSKSYYKYYHPRGDSFKRDVGRKWALNEAGRYSSSYTYDRGMPFDFSSVIPAQYIVDEDGRRLFAPFNRQLLPCLTVDKDSLNTIGIILQISFDGGSTWQIIPASVSSLKGECGIYFDEVNLAEMVDQAEGTISGGPLDGIQLNFWTSLCDDKLNNRSFKNGQWKTRLRITASIQVDQRLFVSSQPSTTSGSPFLQSQLYDFSEKYGLIKRTQSSIFDDSDLPAYQLDSSEWFSKHLQAIRDANEDMSISGAFTLERLWLSNGRGYLVFAPGDSIEKITGRSYDLSASVGGAKVYPEIIQIIYMPEQQKMKLITRDLRFAEVLL